MSRADDLRAELALLELEEQYREAKASGADREELKAIGLADARRAFREQREGGAVATPDTVAAKADVPETGA